MLYVDEVVVSNQYARLFALFRALHSPLICFVYRIVV